MSASEKQEKQEKQGKTGTDHGFAIPGPAENVVCP
jgi:hypothetical protein